MTPHQIVAVALRLFAVWLVLQTLKILPAFFTERAFQSPSYVWVTFVLALTIVISLALWFFPRTIAGKLLPPFDPQPRPPAAPEQWLAIGCTLMGLWLLTSVIPGLVYDALALKAMSSSDDRSELQHWVIYYMVELLIAVWLILGAKGVREVFRWAQNAGVRKDL